MLFRSVAWTTNARGTAYVGPLGEVLGPTDGVATGDVAAEDAVGDGLEAGSFTAAVQPPSRIANARALTSQGLTGPA